ncbi:hypothetical protein TL16_g03859 [Triparma laevis f. inornata]|uniref:ABM domain-containing protein n=1 Tax=Triparma laevis f. inornata TaxID=1714386 RepID=A0A9W7A8U2_9STRA|nr:hypothetical protein TL16_g03859 [Triparma laevis f. inornata]
MLVVRAFIMNSISVLLALLLFLTFTVNGFVIPVIPHQRLMNSKLAESVASAPADSATSELKPISMDRYYATNRFTVRKDKGAKFEQVRCKIGDPLQSSILLTSSLLASSLSQRWTKRKSRLATLPGFKYFHLMRRVKLNEGDSFPDNFDYVSLTVWADKKSFNLWRQGDAFKEAHGGTSVWAFTKTMVQSLRVLKTAPAPAFYDGLLQLSNPPTASGEIVDGWRTIEADGKQTLTAESFVATNQFYVPPENGPAFEARWAGRESSLKDLDGFVSFSLLRRDGRAKGHGIKPLEPTEATYQSTTIWRDRKAFQAWRDGQSFKNAHGEKDEKPAAQKPLWTKPPTPVFYEGVLVISSEQGA